MKLTVDPSRSRALLEPERESGADPIATPSSASRVPFTGEFVRLEEDGRLATVMAVIWEPDGCITLELDAEPAGAVAEACVDIPEWWFG